MTFFDTTDALANGKTRRKHDQFGKPPFHNSDICKGSIREKLFQTPFSFREEYFPIYFMKILQSRYMMMKKRLL